MKNFMNRIIGEILIWISNFSLFRKLEFPLFLWILSLKLKGSDQAKPPRLFWGPKPILNNKYWSSAMSKNFHSKTVMESFYSSINNIEDFDIYVEEILKNFRMPLFICYRYKSYFLTYYALKNYDIFHIPFTGCFLGGTVHWKREAALFKKYNKKFVLLPYGSDAYIYSAIKDESFQNALLISYPDAARTDNEIRERVNYWSVNADFIPAGFMIDGFPRWDAVVGNFVTFSTEIVNGLMRYSDADGLNDTVYVAHCPNHRGAKGTEFIIDAVNKLKSEGFLVELVLMEGLKNDVLLSKLQTEVDVLVEQLVMGYGLNAIEGMACGLPTISNLSIDSYTKIFRRYASLNECPILSATPETIIESLRVLITNPKLRKSLGMAGKEFVRKYHSEAFAQFLFSKVYDKIWYNKSVDLMTLFHPYSRGSYNNSSPLVVHPLVENKIS